MRKTVLITGGSEGLGKEVASVLRNDYNVIILSNHEESLKKSEEELKVPAVFCDITDPEAIEKSVKEISEIYGGIDILINNAGIWLGGELDSSSYDDIARVLMVNALGTIYMTKAVLPFMKKKGSGKIINIGSINGVETKTDRSVYIASKWAVTGFTKAMRKELEKYGIAVIGLQPGLMRTELHRKAGTERDYTCAMSVKDVAKVVEFAAGLENIVLEQVVFRNLHCEIF